MIRRLGVSLLLVHLCLAVLLIGSEELHDWHQYEQWQFEENRLQKPFSPVLGKDVQEAISVDHWLNNREKTLHTLNIPVSLLLGWYSHPMSIYANSVFGPLLLRLCHHTSVKSRVVILDVILLVGICFQWWLVGLWLQRPAPIARMLRAVAASMTLLGIVTTLIAIPREARSYPSLTQTSFLTVVNRRLRSKPGRVSLGTLQPYVEAHDGSYVDFVKYFSNRSCDRFAPSSVKTTDFALVAGSEMKPF